MDGLEAPEQVGMGLVPYDYTQRGQMGVWMFVSFVKLAHRAKCSLCGARRILYAVKMGDIATSPARCGRCAGIR